jgi:hypothetical protein
MIAKVLREGLGQAKRHLFGSQKRQFSSGKQVFEAANSSDAEFLLFDALVDFEEESFY